MARRRRISKAIKTPPKFVPKLNPRRGQSEVQSDKADMKVHQLSPRVAGAMMRVAKGLGGGAASLGGSKIGPLDKGLAMKRAKMMRM